MPREGSVGGRGSPEKKRSVDDEEDLQGISETTKDYLRDWDDFEIAGNPELKETVRANIIRAERGNEPFYRRAARDMGISVDELKERMQARVEELVQESDFFIATSVPVLEEIVGGDGRWKSQFETQESGGMLYHPGRADVEMRAFGFNRDKLDGSEETSESGGYYQSLPHDVLYANVKDRPVYGFCSNEENGAVNEQGSIPPRSNLVQYGKVNVKLKKERVLKKSTFILGDLLTTSIRRLPPVPTAKPHFTIIDPRYLHRIFDLEEMQTSVSVSERRYAEVQYHGGVTLDDVASVHLSRHNYMYPDEITRVKECIGAYNKQHLGSEIAIVEF